MNSGWQPFLVSRKANRFPVLSCWTAWPLQDDVRQFVVRREVKEGKKSKAEHLRFEFCMTFPGQMFDHPGRVFVYIAVPSEHDRSISYSRHANHKQTQWNSSRLTTGPEDPALDYSSTVAAKAVFQGAAFALMCVSVLHLATGLIG